MYIANPIYDTVFKHLMENNRVARFFVETIIGQPVESIAVCPQEYTNWKPPTDLIEKIENQEERDKLIEAMSVIRYDFLATVRTSEGHKKVLIEVQKAKNAIDIMRFRTYLGEQYKRMDMITVNGKETETPLPIVTIYMLGFKLPETDAVVIHVNRTYRDVLGGKVLHVKCDFIECLTHDSYVVQIPRIEGKNQNRLENMLSLFEQKNFYDEKRIIKKYIQEVDDDNIRLMLEILVHIVADPKKQKELELEWRSTKFLDDYFNTKRALEDKDMTIAEKDNTIAEKDMTISGLQQEKVENAKIIAEQAARIAELERKYGLN
jgi:hypothetical protein